MSFPNRDAQILAHILEYCNRIEKTLSRFGREFDVFLDDQDGLCQHEPASDR